MGIIIAVAVIVLLVLWAVSCQRKLAVMDENINNAMAQIGVQLSSRFDALSALFGRGRPGLSARKNTDILRK